MSQCICKSCKKSYKNGIAPTFAFPDEIHRNKGMKNLSNLSELEERLVALRIPFLQIKEMGPRYKKPQLGLTRGVINVPTCINRIQSTLPRNIRETDTVVVAIKRRLKLKNSYAIGRVRIHIVMKALKQLCQTMLYKLEDVKIDNEWEKVFIENKESYDSETDIEHDCTDIDDLPEPITKTLIHGFIDAHTIYDLANKQINVAPAEGYMPLGIFHDKYSKEMSFPSLFYGSKRIDDIIKNFT